jgi:hypothetical protein
VLSPETDGGNPSRVQPVFNLPLMMTFGGIGSHQTRDQISGWSFLLPFVLFAAVVSVVEVPGLSGCDRLAASGAVGLAGGDQWFELSAAGDVCVGVAAGVPA